MLYLANYDTLDKLLNASENQIKTLKHTLIVEVKFLVKYQIWEKSALLLT